MSEQETSPLVTSVEEASPPPTEWPELEDPTRLQQIITIIEEDGAIEREKITPEATLETMGLASMDVVMILMGVEEKLDIYLPMDAELTSARNMSEFVSAIDKALKSGSPVDFPKKPNESSESND
ncbi:MAG: acyl carrier protein [Fimbriimonadaceae bacterium]|nr:acyl carrier protein [Alphaproteobacteria bacterium]